MCILFDFAVRVEMQIQMRESSASLYEVLTTLK